MYGLDLFSGIGGLTKALDPWVKPVAYCENDRYAQAVLLSRMAVGDIPEAPIWEDVQTLRGDMLPEINILYGGFPCQDVSLAGRGAGLAGKRSGLFFEIARLVGEIRPQFVFLENSPAIAIRGLGTVIEEFARLRYDCRWGILSAKDVGARHERQRWFFLAYADDKRRMVQLSTKTVNNKKDNGNTWKDQAIDISTCIDEGSYGGDTEDIRMADGIPYWVERLGAMGNAVVPAQAREAFRRLMGF